MLTHVCDNNLDNITLTHFEWTHLILNVSRLQTDGRVFRIDTSGQGSTSSLEEKDGADKRYYLQFNPLLLPGCGLLCYYAFTGEGMYYFTTVQEICWV